MREWLAMLLRHRPKSFLKLILAGYLIVALPPLLALAYSALSIDRLAMQSKDAVYQAEKIAHGSRILFDQVAAMEHSVRLSLILNDSSLLEGFDAAHEQFASTAEGLSELPLKEDQRHLLDRLISLESSDYKNIGDARNSGQTLNEVSFAPLIDAARSFMNHGDIPIEREVNAMQKMAGRARRIVLWQLLSLFPAATLLAFFFSWAVNRPIRQIDDAIRVIGQGELSHPFHVDGPDDLRHLGERLDWMRQRLLDLEEQKTRFLQNVSHELKTPLTSIREGADLLASGVVGQLNEKQMQVAKILHGNSVELQKRIEDLLDYSAIQSGESVFIRNDVHLRQIVDATLQDHYLSIMSKSLQIDLVCPEIVFECDEQKTRIIIDNLVSNAVKFSPQGGKISVHAERTGDCIALDVVDEGQGVDPIDRSRIFDAFYQGRKAPQSTGTGLGLSIAREYAKAQGGSLELLDSESGAHFRLCLPA